MKTFNSFDSFATHMQKSVESAPKYERAWGTFCANLLEKEAKDKIGHQQEGWADLAESTKADKERKGYVFNADYNPLFREGDLRDSIKGHYLMEISPFGKLFIGSFSEIMVYQALGTKYIPPRDPIGPTLKQAVPEITYALAQAFLQLLKLSPPQIRRKSYGAI